MDPARPTAQPAPAQDPPRPGPDEVIVSVPPARHLCNDRGHRNTGRLADVLVTFGVFGSHLRRDAFWPEVWGRTYPLCDMCWTQTLAVLQQTRPRLAIREVPTL
jgi:hypothetical protein